MLKVAGYLSELILEVDNIKPQVKEGNLLLCICLVWGLFKYFKGNIYPMIFQGSGYVM